MVSAGLGAAVAVVFVLSLMIGNTFYGLGDVIRVVLGDEVQGASFTVGQLRLPRAVLGVLAGFAFGIAGVTFQTMLRNPLASPDVIGISSGASAAAVIGIITFGLSDSGVSMMALGGALLTGLGMYVLASRGGFAGGRLVLIGIGFAALLQSVVAYTLSRAAEWDLQGAMQWLTGSLNGATWKVVTPLAVVCVVFATTLLTLGRDLSVLRLGDDSSAALGLRVHRTRLLLLVAAVVLIAFATASAGPIAFVAFMSGPIAARLAGPGASLIVPAGLVGALLVLTADLVGQNLFDHRYPVGVITGIMGAPYLVLLLVFLNRSGGSL
ncbi:MAG: iron ABC transporter permease [Ilumatobacteraceae bacterium]